MGKVGWIWRERSIDFLVVTFVSFVGKRITEKSKETNNSEKQIEQKKKTQQHYCILYYLFRIKDH